MRAWDLDVKVELQDDDAIDQLAVLGLVKDLLETLSQFEKVNVNITQVVYPEEEITDVAHLEAQAGFKVDLAV